MTSSATTASAPAAHEAGDPSPGPLAYVTAEYPGPSHTFILREVRALRQLRVDVRTFSIRRTHPERVLSVADREEFDRTYAVLPTTPSRLLGAHLTALLTSPAHYASTLLASLRQGAPGLRGRLWQFFYFVEAMIIWRHCRRLGVRHLHAQFGNVAGDVSALAARFGAAVDDRPWSWSLTVHGSSEFYELGLNRLIDKVHSAAFVVCVSDFGRSQLMSVVDRVHWDKLHVVHCGVAPAEYLPVDRRGRDASTLRVLTVGRLANVKGHAVLLEALADLVGHGRDVQFTVVGDGPERAALERIARRLGIEDRVTFAGAVGQDRIRDFYSRADVFCLPSFFEGLPVVLMEAMSTELPVVTTAITGVPELVEHEQSGLLVRPGRADLLAQALARIADAPEDERLRMGQAGRRRVLAEFDVEPAARSLRRLFADHAPGA